MQSVSLGSLTENTADKHNQRNRGLRGEDELEMRDFSRTFQSTRSENALQKKRHFLNSYDDPDPK